MSATRPCASSGSSAFACQRLSEADRVGSPHVSRRRGCVSRLVTLLVIAEQLSCVTPPFRNPPLVLTVLEIRYPDISGGLTVDAVAAIKEAVHDSLPIMVSLVEHQIGVAIDAPVPPQVTLRPSSRFCARDQATALVVRNDALVLETTDYAGWAEHFGPLTRLVTEALERICAPDGVLRIGLRYIDEIRVPGIGGEPEHWDGYINPRLLAAAAADLRPAGMNPTAWQGNIQYQTDASCALTVRYGPQTGYAVDPEGPTRRKSVSPSGPYFLLDSDAFWTSDNEIPEFAADGILEQCDRVHQAASDFFKIAVTDKLRTEVFDQRTGDPT